MKFHRKMLKKKSFNTYECQNHKIYVLNNNEASCKMLNSSYSKSITDEWITLAKGVGRVNRYMKGFQCMPTNSLH